MRRRPRSAAFLLAAALLCSAGVCQALPGDVLSERPAPGRTGTGLTFDGKRIWVADHGSDELIAVQPEGGRVLQRLRSPGYRPAGLAYDGAQLWCVDTLEAKLYRIDPGRAGLVTRVVPAPVAIPVALAWDGSALWLSDDAGHSIHRVDPGDGTTIAEIPFPGRSVDGLTFDGMHLWVADRLADQLYALDTRRGEVVASLPSPGPHPSGLAFDGEHLLVLDYQTDKISTVRRDDEAYCIRGEPRRAWVVFTHQVRNFGPDPLPEVEVFVALPSDLESQKLEREIALEPAGKARIETDQWGQRAAHFHFSDIRAGSEATVRLAAELTAWDVQYVLYPQRVQSLWRVPVEIRKRYLADAPKYDIQNPVIRKAVEQAVGKETNPYWIARKIYRHIHERMQYERVGGWDVAPKVLERGSGSCSEYTFVFIAMCRAAGLPARYAGSLVVRRDDASFDDVYHRWAEVYLPPYGWVPVDPSRGDKKTEAERAAAFGRLTHDFLITTHGGGGSSLLDWNYNANERYTCAGRCKVEVEGIAEWSPENPLEARKAPVAK
ncbi:MAG: transglutaminase [Deltaproteobacteria bacterium]|nr:transglutaminase [Deltaproteobacteria bacterium]